MLLICLFLPICLFVTNFYQFVASFVHIKKYNDVWQGVFTRSLISGEGKGGGGGVVFSWQRLAFIETSFFHIYIFLTNHVSCY